MKVERSVFKRFKPPVYFGVILYIDDTRVMVFNGYGGDDDHSVDFVVDRYGNSILVRKVV